MSGQRRAEISNQVPQTSRTPYETTALRRQSPAAYRHHNSLFWPNYGKFGRILSEPAHISANALRLDEPDNREPDDRRDQSPIAKHGRRHFQRLRHHPLHGFGEERIERALDHQNKRQRRKQIGHLCLPPSHSRTLAISGLSTRHQYCGSTGKSRCPATGPSSYRSRSDPFCTHPEIYRTGRIPDPDHRPCRE